MFSRDLGSTTAVNRGYWDPTTGADASSVPEYFLQQTNGYYNWYAATAGSGTSAMTSDASDSICPHGWRLPIGYTNDTDKSWYRLLSVRHSLTTNGDSSAEARKHILSVYYTGGYNFTSNSLVNTEAGYWAASGYLYTSDAAYMAWIIDTGVWSTAHSSKAFGYSVRCVKK